MDKSSVLMGKGDIMIDDNQENLFSVDAEYRILFENIPNTDWNNEWYDGGSPFNLYNYTFKNYTMNAWI